jgi:trimethylamine:corrinoid methyltransferase-like protein
MSGIKSKGKHERLTRSIRTRITETSYKRLEKLRLDSNCQTIGEVARLVLSKQKILCLYKDISLNAPLEELTSIRKELKAIGVNINQQTKHFHTSDSDTQRAFFALKTAEIYKGIEPKINRLLVLVAQISEKWLQKS